MFEISRFRELYIPKIQVAKHSNKVLEGLNDLREQEQNILIDITIRISNFKYHAHKVVLSACSDYFRAMFNENMLEAHHAHKVVLSACSDYFRAMFNENMLEARNDSVTLYDISAKSFQLLLNYMYTSQLELNEENVEDVLEVAVYLQIDHVINKCSEFLEKNLSTENYVEIVKIAEIFAIEKLRTAVYKYICNNLSVIAELEHFSNFSFEHIESILKFDFPVDCTELDVLRFVLKWLFSGTITDALERLEMCPSILNYICYEQISKSALDQLLDDIFIKYCKQNSYHIPLYKTVATYIKEQPSIGSDLSCSTFNSRGMQMALIKIGGFGKNGITNNINFCFSHETQWKFLTKIPHVEQCNFGTAVLDNNLYVIGGCFNNHLLQEIVHPFGFKYNPRLNIWSEVPAMRTDRCRFTLNACNGKLYAIGGVIEFEGDAEYTNTCECLDPNSLPDYRSQHATASVTINGVTKLYFIFVVADTWEEVTRVPTPRHHAGVVAHGSKLYIIGGFVKDSIFEKDVAPIECYDILTNKWTYDEKNIQEYWEHNCATLYIPKYIDFRNPRS
ncbi:BTB And C-terminal Kelch [Popillia japonica]|uniref:Kelch-like protein diablo n=1 Tax=Popillia japonica TaxID=7064 RepID=A0AAW1JXG5_POPJA